MNVANPGIKFTTVLFAKQTDCLLVGDNDGQVAVYELRNMPIVSDSGRVRLKSQNFMSFYDFVLLKYSNITQHKEFTFFKYLNCGTMEITQVPRVVTY